MTKYNFLAVKVVNAQQLSCTLRTDIDRVVQCLQTCAVMVLGNWVLRSDLLYSTTHNGIPPQAMIRARDYIVSNIFYLTFNCKYNDDNDHQVLYYVFKIL